MKGVSAIEGALKRAEERSNLMGWDDCDDWANWPNWENDSEFPNWENIGGNPPK